MLIFAAGLSPELLISEPVVTESVAAPEPADTVVAVDETPAVSAVEDVPAEEAAATEAVADAEAEEATEEVAEEEVTEEIPDAEALEDHNGYNMAELAKISTEATITQEKKKAIDYSQIYADYVNDEIVKNIEGGIAALQPDTANPDKDYVRKELLGLVSAQVYDFGNDGIDELVTVTREQVKDVEIDNGVSKATYKGVDTNNTASFMLNLYQYNSKDKKVELIGRQTLGSYDLTYAGYSRLFGGDLTGTNPYNAYTEMDSLEGENDSQFQLAIVGDSIYFVQEQNTDLKSQDDNNPNANRITHKVFTVDTKNAGSFSGISDIAKTQVGGAISNPYVLNINRTTATEYIPKNTFSGVQNINTQVAAFRNAAYNANESTTGAYTKRLLYVNEYRYKDVTGNDFSADHPGEVSVFTEKSQQAATEYIRNKFKDMKVPVNQLFLVDDVYNDDTIYLDVRFAQEDVTMLTQYETSPKFKTVDFTPVHGNAVHPAGTSEGKSGSSNGGSSSSSNGGTTSSPNTGDSRVPVAAGAAAVAAAAAAVAFVSKKRG